MKKVPVPSTVPLRALSVAVKNCFKEEEWFVDSYEKGINKHKSQYVSKRFVIYSKDVFVLSTEGSKLRE